MGLTHHWKRPTELSPAAFKAAVFDCRAVFGDLHIELAGFDGTGQPILDEDRLVFNGRSPKDCEPFELAAVEFDLRGRSEFYGHCKTNHLPYDLAVKSALIIFAHHFEGDIEVFSDEGDDAWDQAKSAVQQCHGYGSNFALSVA